MRGTSNVLGGADSMRTLSMIERIVRSSGIGVLALAMVVAFMVGSVAQAAAENAAVVEAGPEGAPAPAPVVYEADKDTDGAGYRISAFRARYDNEDKVADLIKDGTLPIAGGLLEEPVTLLKVQDGYVAPRPGFTTVSVVVSEAVGQGAKFYESALRRIGESMVESMNRRGVIGVYVTVGLKGQEAEMVIFTSRVTKVRTIAFGGRADEAERVDFSGHQAIRNGSPVRAELGADILRKDALDEYIYRLNRHPGRAVDVAVSRGNAPSEVNLDYLVSENKPWLAYAQVSNTGTDTTREWRERFGFIHNQLTGHDDILALDYNTANFRYSHALMGSYEFPVIGDRVRLKLFGTYSDFTAEDVGLADEDYKGQDWSMGAELIWNVYQYKQLFVDVFGGARWRHIRVENDPAAVQGDEDFFLPRIGARLERVTPRHITMATAFFEFNAPAISDSQQRQMEYLGRLNPDEQWVTFQWDFRHTLFMDEWFDYLFGAPKETLAHELTGSFRGQYAFDYRLIPNFEDVIGGMYTVRGYPESTASGDTALVASIEYGLHIPRLFNTQPTPKTIPYLNTPFRVAPQQPYGAADWDLVVRPFFDIGRTMVNDRLPYENNETLMGTGIGLELALMRNFSMRCDYGIGLSDTDQVKANSYRVHFCATLSF